VREDITQDGTVTISLGDDNEQESPSQEITTQSSEERHEPNVEASDTETRRDTQQEPEKVTPEPEQPQGYDLVDFNDLPPELRPKFEARFKRLYGQVKSLQTETFETSKQLRQFHDKMSQLEREKQELQLKTQREDLVTRIVQANNRADFKTAAELQAKLSTVEAQTAQFNQPAPQRAPAQDDGKVKVLNYLSSRPELASNTGLQGWVMKRGQAIAEMHPEKTVDEVLQMVDAEVTKMTAPQAAAQPRAAAPSAVLSGNAAPRPSGNRVTLSPAEQRIAEKMWPELDRGAAHRNYAEGKKLTGLA